MRPKNFSIVAVIGVIFLYSQNIYQQPNTTIKSFSEAKKYLNKVIYSQGSDRRTFYCGCSFSEKMKIDSENCGYAVRKDKKRAGRVEWEHIVPASEFGKNLTEWKDGHPNCKDGKGNHFKGRNCASKMNRSFQFMQADMYNLVPAVGEINADRKDYNYGIIAEEKREYGKCDFEINNQTAEPPLKIRGNIARTYMYMDSAYPGFNIINKNNLSLFEEWDNLDPVDIEECRRSAAIEKIQKNQNIILQKRCEKISY